MRVHEIFHSIQGEGAMVGTPMTFVRLYGCNLTCWFCDTPQRGYTDMEVREIVETVTKITPCRADGIRREAWVCVTGGEPMIHKGLGDLVDALHDQYYHVAVETNGTTDPLDRPEFNWTCVSPKSDEIDPGWFTAASEVKILVGSGILDEERMICRCLEWRSPGTIFVQPIWTNSEQGWRQNITRALRLVSQYRIRLSVQVHKLINIK